MEPNRSTHVHEETSFVCAFIFIIPYLQLTESPSVGWADLTDGDKLSCCREPCLRMLSVCGDNAGLYRCQVSNRAGMVVSDPTEVVLGEDHSSP